MQKSYIFMKIITNNTKSHQMVTFFQMNIKRIMQALPQDVAFLVCVPK
ncbi:hypothetical protein N288_08720 [Bacillus infantis NRRL B-14911]|uniref:Uncharacterized protein n=1 Tax=Bacillus infantis NRRL B-14911 TaxID=1367477 RepID=U5LAC1_9BACI|nr:hypothetical protein N288_08720 [Bacillus infantis NRRL B-14911]